MMTSPESSSVPPAEEYRWFAEQVQAHERPLRAYLRGAFPAVRDVDDVVQESYLRIWKARTRGPIASAKALLFTVARRLALDVLRKKRRAPFVPVTDLAQLCVLDAEADAAARAGQSEEIALLVAAIEALPPRCRAIFILRKLEGVSQKEIAARLGLSEQTVQVQAARGMVRCGEFLRRHLEGRP